MCLQAECEAQPGLPAAWSVSGEDAYHPSPGSHWALAAGEGRRRDVRPRGLKRGPPPFQEHGKWKREKPSLLDIKMLVTEIFISNSHFSESFRFVLPVPIRKFLLENLPLFLINLPDSPSTCTSSISQQNLRVTCNGPSPFLPQPIMSPHTSCHSHGKCLLLGQQLFSLILRH